MDDMQPPAGAAATGPTGAPSAPVAGDAFRFYGRWQEFAPIAFTNLLLTIVTLGVYHFWAKTRVRRYLWTNTRFIDDRLDWTGTGLELFIGYLIAAVLFVLPFGLINLIAQGALMRGHEGAAALIVLLLYGAIVYLVGVAMFRALRYRLSRTYWHGIRGGSDDPGFRYGLGYLWRTIAGTLALGLMIPWAMTTLWNRRWNRMTFGPTAFRAGADWRPIFPRFLLFYLAPIILFIAAFALIAAMGTVSLAPVAPGEVPGPAHIAGFFMLGLIFIVGFYGGLGLVAMIYYSAYFREAVGTLSLGDLQFQFQAETWDWIKLYLGNVALVIFTLGIGYIFLDYRNWAFFIRHMAATGTIELTELTRSTTREPSQGEGLLDAFDVGAF